MLKIMRSLGGRGTGAQDDDIVTGRSDVAYRVVEERVRRCLGEGRGRGTGIRIRRFECLGKVYNVPHEPNVSSWPAATGHATAEITPP